MTTIYRTGIGEDNTGSFVLSKSLIFQKYIHPLLNFGLIVSRGFRICRGSKSCTFRLIRWVR